MTVEVEEANQLAARLWTTNCLTTTLGEWLRRPIGYVSSLHKIGPVSHEVATSLEIGPGSPVTYRCGYLETTVLGVKHTVARVRSVVAQDLLVPEEKLALESRTVAWGHLLRQRGMRRRTHTLTHVSGRDDTGGKLMELTATVIVAGKAVAVVDEIVYDNIFSLTGRHTYDCR